MKENSHRSIDISVVIPIYNEEENLSQLSNRLHEVLGNELKTTYEIIFVDDGSVDNSWQIIEDLHRQDKHVKAVRFSRNFGHHIAVTAGIDYCIGNVVVLMDGDLQDPPEEIPKLYSKLREGYDIVCAVREQRKDSFLKKISSNFFHSVFRLFGNVDIPPDTGIFRIMSRQTVDALKECREKSRFITALMSWSGFSHVGVRTNRDMRRKGKTKYSFVKLIRLALDGIIAFSYFPLRIASYIGVIIALVSFLLGLYMLIKKLFFDIPIQGYASIIVSILFIGGIQLLILGMIGEYIGRIYTEAQNRPMYIIKKKVGSFERERY